MLKKCFALICAALSLFGCSRREAPVPAANGGEFRVVRVLDGDTIVIRDGAKTVKVRLIGVDTPESVHQDEDKNTREGKIVSERMKHFLTNKRVTLEFDKERYDKYDRLLAYVYLDGEMVNKMLLTAGLARTLTIPPNTKRADEFAEIEQFARERRMGFWGSESDLFTREE